MDSMFHSIAIFLVCVSVFLLLWDVRGFKERYHQEKNDLTKEIKNICSIFEKLSRRVTKAEHNTKEICFDLETLSRKIDEIELKIDNIELETDDIKQRIDDIKRETDDIKQRIDETEKIAAQDEETEDQRKEREINERLGKDIRNMLSYDPYEAFRKKAGR